MQAVELLGDLRSLLAQRQRPKAEYAIASAERALARGDYRDTLALVDMGINHLTVPQPDLLQKLRELRLKALNEQLAQITFHQPTREETNYMGVLSSECFPGPAGYFGPGVGSTMKQRKSPARMTRIRCY
jgi:hypothetical protein